MELHDTENENSACGLDAIAYQNRVWYDSTSEAKEDKSYDNCHWCLGGPSRKP